MTKGEDTRDRILDHAMVLASVVGLEGLSLGGLAKQSGLSKSGLFAHFDSKVELQLGVLATARERFTMSVVRPALAVPRGEPRVRALFDNWLAWESGRTEGGCPFVAANHELDDRPGVLREALLTTQKEWIANLARAVRLAVEEAHFRPDLDVEQVAYEIYSIFLGYHLYHRLLRDQRAEERARAAFERLIYTAK